MYSEHDTNKYISVQYIYSGSVQHPPACNDLLSLVSSKDAWTQLRPTPGTQIKMYTELKQHISQYMKQTKAEAKSML
jgi:hypothetical protein